MSIGLVGGVAVDDSEFTVENAGVLHRVAADPHETGPIRAIGGLGASLGMLLSNLAAVRLGGYIRLQ